MKDNLKEELLKKQHELEELIEINKDCSYFFKEKSSSLIQDIKNKEKQIEILKLKIKGVL